MSVFAFYLPLLTASLTVGGLGYSLLTLWGLRQLRQTGIADQEFATPEASLGVSILKPLRGTDPRQYAGFASHCRQVYDGPYEIVFGVTSLDDPAVAAIGRLRCEFPDTSIRMVECTARLGTNGKVSSLSQMFGEARFDNIIVNDSDIAVSPHYLHAIMQPFRVANPPRPVGLVTVPYIGLAEQTLWSRLEALGVTTDFIPGVLAARALEGGLRFGLGSTLATTRTALVSIGGFAALVNELADDYELGARLFRAGYQVLLVSEVVATNIPAYSWRGFADHQLRWARSTRDSRRAGYLGVLVTFVLPWALATVLASGASLWSLSLLSLTLVVRLLVVLNVGVGFLRDGQVLRDLALVPLRDLLGLAFWAWSYASDVVVWRGERFRLHRGTLVRLQ